MNIQSQELGYSHPPVRGSRPEFRPVAAGRKQDPAAPGSPSSGLGLELKASSDALTFPPVSLAVVASGHWHVPVC